MLVKAVGRWYGMMKSDTLAVAIADKTYGLPVDQ